jgi:hypothetical protein
MDDINIKYPTRKFDFSKIDLIYPKSVASGSYFTKILYDSSPVYLQIPKCTTKNGLVKTAKKMTCELLIDNMNEETVGWFENLDNRCKELLHKNSEDWFGSSISVEDIDTAFGSTIRLYKSGKFSLVKTNIKVNTATDLPILSVYDEKQNPQSVDIITQDTNIVAILEITGIKFTSRHFNLEIEMKQIMTVDDSYEEDICFNRCMITPRSKADPMSVSEPVTRIPMPIFAEKELVIEPTAVKEQKSNVSLIPSSLEMYIPESDPIELCKLEPEQPSTANNIELEEVSEVDIEPDPEPIKEKDELCDLSEADCLEAITLDELTLNKPEEIYYELYRKTKQKAKEALLEAKRIKEQYQLDVSDWETDDEDEDI